MMRMQLVTTIYSTQNLDGWEWDHEAYCHQDGGYWLDFYRRQILVEIPEGNKGISTNDTPDLYYVWGPLLCIQYKMVNRKTGIEQASNKDNKFLVIPESNYEKVIR